MDKANIAALLALGAASFIAIGDVIHQRSAHDVTDEPVSRRPVPAPASRWSVVAWQRDLGRRIRAAGRRPRVRVGARLTLIDAVSVMVMVLATVALARGVAAGAPRQPV